VVACCVARKGQIERKNTECKGQAPDKENATSRALESRRILATFEVRGGQI
jgi:hypothetical protein